jgi:hypothetical protein
MVDYVYVTHEYGSLVWLRTWTKDGSSKRHCEVFSNQLLNPATSLPADNVIPQSYY